MRPFRALVAATLAAAAMTGAAAAASLDAYGGLPSIESVAISPNGATLALVVSDGEQRTVMIKDLAGGVTHLYGVGPAKIRRLDWMGAEHLIITASRTADIADITGPKREYFLGFDLNFATQEVQPLMRRAPGPPVMGTNIQDRGSGKVAATLNVLAGPPVVRTVDGAPVLYVTGISFPGRWGVLTVFQMDLRTGAARIVELGDRHTNDIALGEDGVPVAKTAYDPESGRWVLKLRQGPGWKESRVVDAKTEPPVLLGLGRDGRSVVVGELGDTGFALREISPDGAWGEPLDVRDADGPIFDPGNHRLIGVHALVGDEEHYTFFDARDQKTWNSVTAAFSGDRVRLESWSQDRKKVVILADSATQGPAYALVDLATHRANWLGGRYQKLRPEDISRVQPVRFKAKDGLELTGYLTLPNGVEPKGLPLVVFPHGGPAARDEPGFDWWAQAMASRGYAVLQVNFRGSDGFSWSFVKAGFGEWGRKMQTDLSDGVRYLAAQGTVDPKRVCIVGASYGGYAALAGAALDPGVYRCAASVAGLSDLRRFVDWSRTENGLEAFRYWTRFMGAEGDRDPVLAQISPAAHVDRVTIPILLVHGRDDTVVPLEQSRIMAEALQRAGKPVELVVQAGADHWLSRGGTRLQTLEAVVAFLEKHNPPH